ncbi:hypothetical protein LguiA_000584 [Lonicera macranthoides]
MSIHSLFHRNHHHLFSLTFLPPLKLPHPKPIWLHMAATTTTITCSHHLNNQNIIVIMGPTGAGKSRLSIDLATQLYLPSEIINSDKIQVYQGLDITTNKITMPERHGVPHHLLDFIDPTQPELTPSEYRVIGSSAISYISSRSRLPILAGGSNSFIYALLAKRFDPDSDIFSGSDPVCTELRYNCCFLWMDVSLPVLYQYLAKRVDEMLDSGMFNELSEFYGSEEFDWVNGNGLKKAIGVPEFEKYFKRFGSRKDFTNSEEDLMMREVVYEEAVREIKDNTCQLAKRQVEKIQLLREAGWDLRRINATEAFRAALGSSDSGGVSSIWERKVVEPSMKTVKSFLEESSYQNGWEVRSWCKSGAAKSGSGSTKGRSILDH